MGEGPSSSMHGGHVDRAGERVGSRVGGGDGWGKGHGGGRMETTVLEQQFKKCYKK